MMTRIACVQFDCINGQRERNADTVRRLTKNLRQGDVEVLVLPEMALSGYLFDSAKDVEPFLEDPDEGHSASPSYALAAQLARRLKCYVSIGFPCRSTYFSGDSLKNKTAYGISKPYDARPVSAIEASRQAVVHGAYNASLLVDHEGDIIHVFRKHFAFEPDKTWSDEGPGFEHVTLPNIGKLCIAICMDVNPYAFTQPFEKYELARYCRENGVDWLVMNLAWLRSDSTSIEKDEDDGLSEAARQHCNYLALRLSPYFQDEDRRSKQSPSPHPLRLITCNRIGVEQSTTFAGYSHALYFDGRSLPRLLGCMGSEEGMAIFTFD